MISWALCKKSVGVEEWRLSGIRNNQGYLPTIFMDWSDKNYALSAG